MKHTYFFLFLFFASVISAQDFDDLDHRLEAFACRTSDWPRRLTFEQMYDHIESSSHKKKLTVAEQVLQNPQRFEELVNRDNDKPNQCKEYYSNNKSCDCDTNTKELDFKIALYGFVNWNMYFDTRQAFGFREILELYY